MNNGDKKERGAVGRFLAGVARALLIVLKSIGTFLLVTVLSVLIFGCIFAVYIKTDLSEQTELSLQNFSMDQTSIIYYLDEESGEWAELQRLYDEENRIWVDYADIPKHLVNASIAIEDKRFYEHKGVDFVTTGKASLRLFLGSGGAGGSTITQQLIKNLTGDQDITIRRKIVEIFRAMDFEKTHSKEEIVELYLNVIYLGQSCNGVRSASQVYFGKDVTELNLAECASLVGITNNPSMYDPYINMERNRERQRIILGQMLEQQMITQAEYDEAVRYEIVLARDKKDEQISEETTEQVEQTETTEEKPQFYSYFVDQVVRDVIDDLAEQGGFSTTIAEKMLYRGGYSIYCTMDKKIQQTMEQVYEDPSNVPRTTSRQQLQSAMVVIDNVSGDIVGIVGGVGEKDGSLTFSRATQAKLSPGSAIKPITVYAPALDLELITPASTYNDAPFTVLNGNPYPKNQGGGYRGLVSVDYAVGQSLNTVPIRLVDQMTPEYCYTFAKEKMGLSTLVSSYEINGTVYTDVALAPLSMGGLTQGITVRDLTNAYAALANEGYYRSARTYTKVLGPDGKVVFDNVQQKHTAVSSKAAWYMTYMLHNATISGTSTKARLNGIDVAAKTGTTTSDHDRWFAAYTPYYTAAVWCGFDEPEEIRVTSTSTNPALFMWKQVMDDVHAELPDKKFEQPDDLVKVSYCRDSGLIAKAACTNDPRGSRVATGYMYAADAPTQLCTAHVAVEVCEVSGGIPTEYCELYGAGTKMSSMLKLPNEEGSSYVQTEKIGYCDVHTAPPAETGAEEPVAEQPAAGETVAEQPSVAQPETEQPESVPETGAPETPTETTTQE